MAHLLAVESHVYAEQRDWNSAVKSGLDDYRYSNQIAYGMPLFTGLMSVGIQGESLRELGSLVTHTEATTTKMAAANMERIYEKRYPYFKTLQQEKWMQLTSNLQMMRKPSWRLNMLRDLNNPHFQDMYSTSWLKSAEMFVISKRKLVNDWNTTMNSLIENARQPYVKARPIPASGDPFVDAMLRSFKRSRWNWARNDTFSVEVMTMYALRAYKMDNGHYPKNLKALVPVYLHKIPIDPFDGIAPLHYRLQGEKYLLWSIGPDGVDNHGKPIINLNKRGQWRYWLSSPDSKGDVVAGINMP